MGPSPSGKAQWQRVAEQGVDGCPRAEAPGTHMKGVAKTLRVTMKGSSRETKLKVRTHLESIGERTCLSGSSCKGSSGTWTASGPVVSSKASKGDKRGSEFGGAS
jgi:hypothetical protein